MFDFLFGWRKASKCKKLIREVQCRLKLLKNKRVTIVRQLKDDLTELLKHGHEQIAFDRVDQLYMDENLVQAYDLLDTFCEFLLINFPYIRKNRDCPNDINEAVSSLIFASARFGDVPELLSVRKLFGERYGQRFTNVALKLLPGNLVNRQIQEKLSIKCVPDNVKAELLAEISRNAMKSGPLLLEYSSELQQQQHMGNEIIVDPIEQSNDEMENEIQDSSENSNNVFKDFCPSFLSSKPIFPSIVKQDSTNGFERLMQKKFETITEPVLKIKPCETTLYDLQMIEQKESDNDSVLGNEERRIAAMESSSESTEQLIEETICFDDIQEFESPMRKGRSNQDQRLFMFRPSVLCLMEKIDNANDQHLEEETESSHEKSESRRFRKNRKVTGKKLGRRSVSIDIKGIKDIECAIYYNTSHDRRKNNHKKISIRNHQKSCYHHNHPQESLINTSNCVKFSSNFSFSNSREGGIKRSRIRCNFEHPYYLSSCDDTDTDDDTDDDDGDCHCYPTVSKIESFSNGKLYIKEAKARESNNPWMRSSCKESRHDCYSRAMSMPTERTNEKSFGIREEHVSRSNSFPVQEEGRCSSSNRKYVHPKLPDYDELAAKFMALKRANLSTLR